MRTEGHSVCMVSSGQPELQNNSLMWIIISSGVTGYCWGIRTLLREAGEAKPEVLGYFPFSLLGCRACETKPCCSGETRHSLRQSHHVGIYLYPVFASEYQSESSSTLYKTVCIVFKCNVCICFRTLKITCVLIVTNLI